MKKIYLVLIVISFFSLIGCNEDNKQLISTNEDNAVSLHFYASIESQPDSINKTKSTLSGTSTDAVRKVLWETTDSIYVTNGTSGSTFYNVYEENTDIADFSGEISLGTNYFAAFPYGIVKSYESSTFHLFLPSIQPYKADGIASESLPMVAQCVDNIFEFKNLCGILVLNLTGTQVIDSISFTGTDDQGNAIKVSGAASVSTSYNESPSLSMSSTALESVTLNCIGSNNKGVTLKTNNPTPFHIVLPAGTYDHFTVVIYSSDHRRMTINSEKSLTIKRSKRTTASSIEYLADKPVYEFVDLGLSVNWATFNVGAYRPEENGDYFAWGEISSKEKYTWQNYKLNTNSNNTGITKYCFDSYYGNQGFVDNIGTLLPEDDVAHVLWGDNWQIPSGDQISELINKCTWLWTTLNDKKGYLVTSNVPGFTDRSIFLPVTGEKTEQWYEASTDGYYWSNNLNPESYGKSSCAWGLRFNEEYFTKSSYMRNVGFTVRPVCTSESWLSEVSIDLNTNSQSIAIGQTFNLIATVKHSNEVLDKTVVWTSNNPSVATITETGLVTGVSIGTTTVTAECYGKTATCEITVTEPVYEYVDLGLSVNWATFNVGANAPEEYGDYYAWGETELYYKAGYAQENPQAHWKDGYSAGYGWPTYKYCNGSETTLTKYCNDEDCGYNGFRDFKTTLDPDDDVAHVRWGGDWRMPTKTELTNLLNNCTWTWTKQKGVNGYLVTSKKTGYEGASIFLPASGYRNGTSLNFVDSIGYYWSSTLEADDSPRYAGFYYYDSDDCEKDYISRYFGLTVRPVCPSESWLNNVSITLNSVSESIIIASTYSLSATVKHGNDVLYRAVSWSSSNPSVATVTENGLVSGVSVGSATITAECYGKTASCEIIVSEPVFEYVDLGLSVNWATSNVGAKSPEEYGNYYSWGETETKSSYTWSNYKFRVSGDSYTDVIFNKYDVRGNIDNKSVLDIVDDVAHDKWGGNWRMPSIEEVDELINNCTWTWTTKNGVNGYLITSKKDGYTNNSIFLPAGGLKTDSNHNNVGIYGDYWSSSLELSIASGGKNNHLAKDLNFYSEKVYTQYHNRYYGKTIRPVCQSETWLNNVSMTLNNNSQSIVLRDTYTLIATVKHGSDIIDRDVVWSSADSTIATVNETGIVTAVAVGSTIITATCLGKTATCSITVTLPQPKYVDLGLSVNWATFNVGANFAEEYGDYYAWGETDIISISDWANYKYCNGTKKTLTKYNTISGYGTVDNVTILSMVDDVAANVWGGIWRLPTKEEMEELINNCNWTWTTLNDIYGYVVQSKISGYTDQKIFLPAAGYYYDSSHNLQVGSKGYYWSSSLYSEEPALSWIIATGSNEIKTAKSERITGHSVRPVCTSEAWINSLTITINKDEINLQTGGSYELTATLIHNNDIIDRSVIWSSNNTSVAVVDDNGLVTAVNSGTATITASFMGKTATCLVNVSIPEYVDLGLSVLWATCNLGANHPEEYGDYYAWGETVSANGTDYTNVNNYNYSNNYVRSYYTWATYKWGDGSSSNGLSKYHSNDNKHQLDPEDDAVKVKKGGKWRMPTREELSELRNNCTWTWTTLNGVNGYKVKSKINNNSIFLPAAGAFYHSFVDAPGTTGNYWSSSIESNEYTYAYYINFSEKQYNNTQYGSGSLRDVGCSIRPVYDEIAQYVDLGLSVKWATYNVGASSPTELGNYYAWGETETKNTYTWDSYKFDKGTYNHIQLTKYNYVRGYGYGNYTDSKVNLDLEDDVAHVVWGENWRMPTYQEMSELRANCTWIWTTVNGVEGYLATSTKTGYTDKSIFFPAEDDGSFPFYWSNYLRTDKYPGAAWGFNYGSTEMIGMYYQDRYMKACVRPVCP